MEERAQAIRGMFSRISPHYDLLNHLLSGNIDRLWRRRVAREVVRNQTRQVLDVCSGTGDLAFALLQRMNGHGSVIGADFSSAMLQRAKQKAETAGVAQRVQFIESDGLKLPFADASFDAVTVAFGLRNLTDWNAGLREMARVTRSGGRVAILEFSVPRWQPFRWLYLFYFTQVLPRLGNAVSRSKAYQYLTDTVLNWPAPDRLAGMMEEAGLRQVGYRPLTGGIACLHVGTKL